MCLHWDHHSTGKEGEYTICINIYIYSKCRKKELHSFLDFSLWFVDYLTSCSCIADIFFFLFLFKKERKGNLIV